MSLGRKIWILSAALFFSATLFAYVHLSAEYETDIDLPINIEPPAGLALKGGLPDKLHAHLKGAGWQLVMMNFTRDAYFAIDLSPNAAIPIAGDTIVLRKTDIIRSAVLPMDVTVQDIGLDSLVLGFDRALRRSIPVHANLDISAADGYAIIGQPIVTPNSISVIASKTVLDSLRYLPTILLTQHDIKTPLTLQIPLSDTLADKIVRRGRDQVQVRVNVQAIGERTFDRVAISVEGVPAEKEVVLFPPVLSVTVRGGVDDLARLNQSSVRARVLYDPIVFDTATAVHPEFGVPANVTYLSNDPRSVRFIVRRRSNAK